MTMHAVTCRLTAEYGISTGRLHSITSMGTFTFTFNSCHDMQVFIVRSKVDACSV